MAAHTSKRAWETPWTEQPGRLQSTQLQRLNNTAKHDTSEPVCGKETNHRLRTAWWLLRGTGAGRGWTSEAAVSTRKFLYTE